jgi:hypothetical protein
VGCSSVCSVALQERISAVLAVSQNDAHQVVLPSGCAVMLSSIFVLDAQHIQAFSDTLEAADAMSMQKSMQN